MYIQAVPELRTQFVPENMYESRNILSQTIDLCGITGFCFHCLKGT